MNGTNARDAAGPCAIAIVGCAGRFPGASDVETFWRNICAGVESVSTFAESELEDAFAPEVRAGRDFIKARSIVDRPEDFDAPFFGMHAREAELTDPQHRVFLECCWQALEDAGYDPARYGGSIGVFAGCSVGSYFLRNVLADRAGIERFTSDYPVASYPELLGGGYDFLATRVAYKLDLRGPAMTVQSACSTSLLAVAQACQTLMLRQADMMLAGAVSISFPQKRGYVYQDGGMVSADGHVRTFDAGANGTVFGDGAGVVVLKRLDDALSDGDSIYAVIRGFGVNNDGSGKAGYTAPSVGGQAAALRAAYAMAGVEPATIGYIECHGTGTPLGDPIELTALKRAFASADGQKTVALGSVKTNVGHLDVASGVTGLIKAALALREGTIPPTLHFETPNPGIDFSDGPFFVNAEALAWPSGAQPRRAAVSSFGVGGTNVHVVLEAYDAPLAPPEEEDAPQLIVVSARSEAALGEARTRLAAHLRSAGAPRFEDVAYTLQAGRRAFPFRSAFVAGSKSAAAAMLESGTGIASGRAPESEPVVAFMFPGQGAQYAGMARDLYARIPSFRADIDRCATILEPLLGCDLGALLFDEGDAHRLTSTEFAQPALFAVEYALARLLSSYGITPAAAVGHSVGEFVAACLAGVFSLDDALAVVAERGRLIRELPRGSMLAVRAGADRVALLLDGSLDVAAFNAPELTVVSGPTDAIERFEGVVAARGLTSRRLHTSHAFHSRMMDPVVERLERYLSGIALNPPLLPYVSGLTGTWITSEEATSPAYWARHCREAVRFGSALETLVEGGAEILIEAGPGTALTTFALQGAAKGGRALALPTLSGSERERPDGEAVLAALGKLWTAGVRLDWDAVHGGVARKRVSLPTYPFERARYWIEPDVAVSAPAEPNAPQPSAGSGLADSARLESSIAPRDASPFAVPAVVSETAVSAETSVRNKLVALLEDLSGESLAGAPAGATFLELGFDSLFLGRVVQQLTPRFGVSVTFRQLLSEIPSVDALAEYVVAQMPAGRLAAFAGTSNASASASAPATAAAGTPMEALMQQQLAAMQQLMNEQLQALKAMGLDATSSSGSTVAQGNVGSNASSGNGASATVQAEAEASSRFAAFRITGAASAETTPQQRAHIDDLIARTVARTPESKRLTQKYRSVLADPRVAAGFRSEWKEMVYPITCVRAKGSRLWDCDGNEYIDLLNGFGQTGFGHAPDFVVEAVSEQLRRGFAIGPQTDLAGEVAELFCEITGNERMTFCNTGSEAVMAALRVARTVTGRDRVVIFDGSYHGQFDEVLVKSASTSRRSLPVALGIPAEAVANITVLPYGTPESLAYIREHANELAAVVVESVQSRHPSLRPAEFLADVREITEASGTAFVFDEVVTGFRMHPGGMQAIFGIRADLATYGKVVGGGMPIGILAGKARFMDALDGGAWQFGDDSFPQVAPTFFAGTFVRHPLVMAAVLAVLRHVKEQGPALQETIARRTAGLVGRLNGEFERRGIPPRIETYGSLFYLNLTGEERLAGLLFYHLRLRGIYAQEGFPCFLTTEHTDADVDAVVAAFAESLDEMQGAGIFRAAAANEPTPSAAPALTEEQTEIWLSAQMGDEASCAFNESVTLRLRGAFDEAAFQSAWDTIVARHDALRASFGTTGETMQVAPPAPFAFERLDLTGRSESEGESALRDAIAADARLPFDLAAGPLVRGRLVTLSADERAFVFSAHHIVCDGWSMNVILSELAALYEAHRKKAEPQLAQPLTFSSYANRQAERDAKEAARTEGYWLGQFAELPPALELPTDRPRPARKTFNGATRTAFVDRAAYQEIKKSGARLGCTLFATLLAGFEVLIGRLSDQSDIVVGVPAAGQALLDDEILVGHCVDFLPLRARWERETTLAQLLGDVKQRVLDAYEHQQYTLGTLVRKLAPVRDATRTPLAEIQFNLERLAESLPFESLSASVEPNPKAFVNFDLFLNVVESNAGLRLDCDYNTDLFDAATIDRWLGYYQTILSEIGRDASQAVSRVPYLAAWERELLARLNETATDYPHEQTVHGLFESSVAKRPGAIAVRCGDASLTYAELDARASRAANLLLSRTKPGGRIAVCVERSTDLLVALLATLKAGCTYVPLDPTHPAKRLSQIMRDANVAVVLVDGSSDPAIVPNGIPALDFAGVLDAGDPSPDGVGVHRSPNGGASAESHASAESPAYVIYTSGSTGTPKGVAVAHRSVVNLLTAMVETLQTGPNDVLLAVTTVSFDIAALELFLPLVSGGTVVIATSDEAGDPFVLARRMQQLNPSIVQATPALWGLLLDADFHSREGTTMLCGGEALPFALAQRLLAGGGSLWNVYGPTETTIWSSCARIEAGDEPITVGVPLANEQFYVLDRNDQTVPIGIAAELCIAGDGVALGYVDRPELEAEKFVANPFGSGRMYRTGDAARVLPNGTVQVLGRLDRQAKLRGFRIEPGEIEEVLRKKAGLAAVAVLVREDVPGERRLACYFVPGTEPVSASTLRELAAAELPEYMVPAQWVALEKLPLTPAGKIDLRALPLPESLATSAPFEPPITETETILAGIWADVLHLERVGRDGDFFVLGGDSIQLFQITARANQSGLALAAKELLKHRTVEALAKHLDDNRDNEAARPERVRPPLEFRRVGVSGGR